MLVALCCPGMEGGRVAISHFRLRLQPLCFQCRKIMSTPSEGSMESCKDENSRKVYYLPLTLTLSAAMLA